MQDFVGERDFKIQVVEKALCIRVMVKLMEQVPVSKLFSAKCRFSQSHAIKRIPASFFFFAVSIIFCERYMPVYQCNKCFYQPQGRDFMQNINHTEADMVN